MKILPNTTVVLVDAANLAYRSQYTSGNLATSTGVKTGVIYSFLRILHNLYTKFESPQLMLFWEGGNLEVVREGKTYIATDLAPTWRKALPRNDYKGNRKEFTEEKLAIHKQIPEVQKMMAYLRYPQFSVAGLEGDDLIGIAAAALSSLQNIGQVAILSSDKDFFQCIDDKVRVYRPAKGTMQKYGPKRVYKEYGVTPEQWAIYKAFVGDASDHYKGVKGVGPKKAIELIQAGAYPRRVWDRQEEAFKKRYAVLEKDWQKAWDCHRLAVIPRGCGYYLFSSELQEAAKREMGGLDNKVYREFSKDELRVAIQLMERFCARYELNAILAEVRKYFKGAYVEGRVLQ